MTVQKNIVVMHSKLPGRCPASSFYGFSHYEKGTVYLAIALSLTEEHSTFISGGFK